ncbi:MAG: hypothetical protein A3G23_09235 [Bacteroidetes bacterium RIFCSPLOWO2_12_FULL_37_12]|nr:MAG: hypothetical protein A3G23_09235 [Bacteroidetes bacterium RIFCSPLOWO2_12_FULL_37_12]
MASSKKHKNSPEVKAFIKENSSLFWYIAEKEKENIDHEVLVEFILNYGDEKSVKKLFDLLGVSNVAKIFYHATRNRRRINYFQRTVYFYNLYFKRHARRNTYRRTKKTSPFN